MLNDCMYSSAENCMTYGKNKKPKIRPASLTLPVLSIFTICTITHHVVYSMNYFSDTV